MPAWITTYLRKPQTLSAETIRKGVANADWWTLGESVGVEEDDVDTFMAGLVWSDEPLEIQARGRPIVFHVWDDPQRVHTEVEELFERDGLTVPERVRGYLPDVRSVVAMELGWSQIEAMEEVLAFEIAYWLAEVGDGVILSHDDRWFDHDAHRWDAISD